ncbi:hypothetical protein FH972_012273 [Carpinus fangiana]|uniref:Uncharacterized protein n=1 Tax=Carpinus fangiana TaxID=176857 RepID=A0A5N6R4R9_9ROSI|nr:hypothetical protein FH972_012273 [Carpinus fangiana]
MLFPTTSRPTSLRASSQSVTRSPLIHALDSWDHHSFIAASDDYQPCGFGTTAAYDKFLGLKLEGSCNFSCPRWQQNLLGTTMEKPGKHPGI